MNWIEVENIACTVNNHIFVECIAVILNNETGEIREYETEELLELGSKHPKVFNWEENNYSCDYNRHIFFKRVYDEVTEDDWVIECTEHRYSVNLKNKKDGKVYYREF